MTDQELLTRAKELQKEAMRVIQSLDVLDIIRKISESEIVGSAKSGLIVTPDIDIHCFMKDTDLERVAALLPVFAKMPTIQKVQFNNYMELRRDHRKDRSNFPHGYYVGLRSIEPSGEWKIDMWFGGKENLGDFDERELDTITDEQRLAILRLKNEWRAEKAYKDGVISTDFYKAVLRGDIKNADEFKKYLKASK